MKILGFDTDAKGSIAFLDSDKGHLDIYAVNNVKVKKTGSSSTELDYITLVQGMKDISEKTEIDFAYLEHQWSRSGQGVVSTFNFGMTYGSCRTAVAAFFDPKKIRLVSGADWKTAMNLSSDKSLSLKLANRLFPECAMAWKVKTKYTSAAEAALLALYGLSQHEKIKSGLIFRPSGVIWTDKLTYLTS